MPPPSPPPPSNPRRRPARAVPAPSLPQNEEQHVDPRAPHPDLRGHHQPRQFEFVNGLNYVPVSTADSSDDDEDEDSDGSSATVVHHRHFHVPQAQRFGPPYPASDEENNSRLPPHGQRTFRFVDGMASSSSFFNDDHRRVTPHRPLLSPLPLDEHPPQPRGRSRSFRYFGPGRPTPLSDAEASHHRGLTQLHDWGRGEDLTPAEMAAAEREERRRRGEYVAPYPDSDGEEREDRGMVQGDQSSGRSGDEAHVVGRRGANERRTVLRDARSRSPPADRRHNRR